MIELAFVACMLMDEQVCRDRSLIYTDMPVMACMASAQTELAQWSDAHPGWRIAKWSCRQVNLDVAEL